MKTSKKFNLILANDIDKEEQWLTEMSAKGFHFFKYKWFCYYFEEDHSKSYIYQADFQAADDEYFELYKQAGWEHVHTEIEQYHYFRAPSDAIGDKRIYSDPASIKGMYKRMLNFYLILFLCLIVAQLGMISMWEPTFFSTFSLALVTAVTILYVFLFIMLLQKITKYNKKSQAKL